MGTEEQGSKPGDGDATANPLIKGLVTPSTGSGDSSAVEVGIKLSIDVGRLTPAQRTKLLEFLASLDNSPAAAIGAGIGAGSGQK